MFPTFRALATGIRGRLAMPLLVKELSEAAARRRTYVLRVVYAVALYGIFAVCFAENFSGVTQFPGYDPRTALLGYGREIFDLLTWLQLFGILLFQPALMCGRI